MPNEMQKVPVHIVANRGLLQRYMEALPLFRRKWLEVQDEEDTLENHHLEQLSPGVFRITQTDWSTHIVHGTELTIIDTNDVSHKAFNLKTVKTKTRFEIISRSLVLNDIQDLIINRGGEKQHQIRAHMKIGKKLLCDSKAHPNVQICASGMSRPMMQTDTLSEWFSQEEKHADDEYRGRRQGMHAQTWQRFRKEQSKTLKTGKGAIDVDITSAQLRQLNAEQLGVAQSREHVVICQGYPGTGKTRTLAAHVLVRFKELLTRRSGWILCLAHTNSATLRSLHHIVQYPSLRPFVRHGFSEMYKAYHPTSFEDFEEYHITPKMELFNHGILVCTLGSLSRLVTKYGIDSQIFDVMVDESGRYGIWIFCYSCQSCQTYVACHSLETDIS